MCVASLSYLSILYWLKLPLSQCIHLSTVSPFFKRKAHSVISIRAYPSVVPPHLELSLFSSTTWCSSMYCSLRVSDSVSLSSNTCCRRSASLPSDDAESSPPSILPFRPTLPAFLSSPSSHTCMYLTDCFYSEASTNAAFSLSPALLADVSPLFAFYLPSLLLICDRELPIQAVGVALLSISLGESACS